MKRIIRLSLLFVMTILTLGGCKKEPEIPEPATPKGLSFQIQDGSILFSWFPAEDALSYGMEIGKDAELSDLIYEQEEIADTFQLVSCDSFDFDSTYHWRVRADGEAGWGDWSDVASFTYSSCGALDLDTTYFPFGLGYEWCYEYHHWETSGYPDAERWDTVFVQVTDSFWENDTLFFTLEGEFMDLDRCYIYKDSIEIDIGYGNTKKTISVTCPLDTTWSTPGADISIGYSGDTLIIFSDQGADTGNPDHGISFGVRRLTGIGPISQGSSAYITGVDYYNSYLLLYFYNGQDSVYKADDWGEVLEVDLDTTYFPMGQGYEWTYQRHSWGEKSEKYANYIWEEYDTFTVNALDSFWEEGIMKIQFSDTAKPFYDLGNPAKILNGKVVLEVDGYGAVTPCVNPCLPEKYWQGSLPYIRYNGDTLKIQCKDEYFDESDEWTKRIRDLGVVVQYTNTGVWSRDKSFTTDSLILFTTPQGQVYP